MKLLIALIATVALSGCAITMPDGTKVSRKYFEMNMAQEIMKMGIEADEKYDQEHPIAKPPAMCLTDNPQTDEYDLAMGAMAISNYNTQVQIRDLRREGKTTAAVALLDQQSRERMHNKSLWLTNPITGALANKLINGSPKRKNTGGGIYVSGGNIKGGGGQCLKGQFGDINGGGCSSSSANIGDTTVNIFQGNNNQGGAGDGSTYTPVLEYATDIGRTSPNYDAAEGSAFNEGSLNNDRTNSIGTLDDIL